MELYLLTNEKVMYVWTVAQECIHFAHGERANFRFHGKGVWNFPGKAEARL